MRTCTKFVQSTIRKIFTVVATRHFGWASPQTPLGELIVLPRPPTWIRGVLRLRRGRERKDVGKGKREEGEFSIILGSDYYYYYYYYYYYSVLSCHGLKSKYIGCE